jgi:hypothetical protein
MACRLIHKALTGAKARRSERVDRRLLNDAWEALEESWIEFEGIKAFSPDPLTRQDDVVRFADGWVSVLSDQSCNQVLSLTPTFKKRIFAFHAHNVIRESLEHRAHVLTRDRESAQLIDLGIAENQPHSRDQYILEIQQLRTIARAKCDHMLQEIVGIIKQHVKTNFFEWDASLVRGKLFPQSSIDSPRLRGNNWLQTAPTMQQCCWRKRTGATATSHVVWKP